MGIGSVVLVGSAIAIPTLMLRANHAETRYEKLQASYDLVRRARVTCDDALKASEEQFTELQGRFDADQKALADAQESKQVLTSQLADIQARNRELEAVRGTLQLRDEEMAKLVQQLVQVRSDYATLLAQHETTSDTAASDTAASDAAASEIASTNAKPSLAKAAKAVAAEPGTAGAAAKDSMAKGSAAPSKAEVSAVDVLLPVTATGTASAPEPANVKTQTAAKPAATPPLRFDDTGWKSVAPTVPTSAVTLAPIID